MEVTQDKKKKKVQSLKDILSTTPKVNKMIIPFLLINIL